MAALVCDICGGKLVMGAGGIAVCDSCGMEHSADRMKEKVQEIKGTVRIDNSHMINNYLELAQSAKDAGNNAETETYCNKIIEIDPSNYHAWMLKGEAAAWQSSIQNLRVDEGVSSFIKAINYAPDDLKDSLIEEAKEQIKSLAVALISLRCERFEKWPDEEEASGLHSDIISIMNTVINFISEIKSPLTVSELMTPPAVVITNSVITAFTNVVLPEYTGSDPDDRPGKYELQNYLDRIGYCTDLLALAIELCDDDDESDIERYQILIKLHKAAINACAWDYDIGDYGIKRWYKTLQLNDAAVAQRKQLILNCEEKLAQIEKAKKDREAAELAEKLRIAEEEAKQRYDAYWTDHAEEKAALEAEKETLLEQISNLEKEKQSIPGMDEKSNIQERIKTLTEERARLGLFKGKEKKILQEKIDAANVELQIISERVQAAIMEIQRKINPLCDRCDEIDNELTMER